MLLANSHVQVPVKTVSLHCKCYKFGVSGEQKIVLGEARKKPKVPSELTRVLGHMVCSPSRVELQLQMILGHLICTVFKFHATSHVLVHFRS